MANRLVFVLLFTTIMSQSAMAQASPTYFWNNLHTYVLTPAGVPMDYHAARAYAKSIGGHLVAINNPNEQLLINFAYQSAGAPKRWIGLTDEVTEGTMLWDSGEPVAYTNFAAGEPNNGGGVEDWCEVAAGGLWNDDNSPGIGLGAAQGIVELPFGDRVDFDVQTPNCTGAFPTPLGAPGDPEGVSWNGAGGAARPAVVSIAVFNSQPLSGTQGMYMYANGPVTSPPAGGPFPRPADPDANEVRIPVPAGALGVSFFWEFLNGEGAPSVNFNDGLSIAIVDAAGNLLLNLVYSDTNPLIALLPLTVCGVTASPREILPGGPQSVSALLPQSVDPMFLSIVCWNAGNNTLHSACELDAVQFWGDGKFKLEIAAPIGAGSISLVNKNGNAGDIYWTGITGNPGAYPYGWFFGIDINPGQLITQISAGPPFSGTLVAPGTSTFAIFAGVPPGLLVYGVSLRFSPAGLFLDSSSPEYFITL